jgi:hypothetical protein
MFEKVKPNQILIQQVSNKIAFSYQFNDEKLHSLAVGRIILSKNDKLSFNSEAIIYTLNITKPIALGEIATLFEGLVS